VSELELRSRRFRQERESDWKKLETLLARAERGSARSLSLDDMIAMPRLYRAALSSLSAARATSLDRALIDYLEALSARAYFFVYGARISPLESIIAFFARDWPRAAQACARETLIATLLFLAGAAAAFAMTMTDPDWFYSFIPSYLAQGRTPAATTEFLRSTLYSDARSGLGVFAAFLFTHNAGVSLLAFALGFAFCLPTAMLLLYTGCTLGAIFALYAQHGLAFELGGWLFIHGSTELLAIILAGAAGLRIGWAIAFPGALSRTTAAARAGRTAATLMVGVIVMLFVAGMLEGFARQQIHSEVVRYGIAIGALLIWLSYLYMPRRARGADDN
jgi:uncharacterized membrane protein SpoIIM required for sporulation